VNNNNHALIIKEVAKFLNISTQMVYNLIKAGELKAFKIGSTLRVLYSDLIVYIERQKTIFESANSGMINLDENVFLFNNVNCHYPGFKLWDINLALPKGKVLALLGPSGSGKSLLLRSIAGLENLDSGEIYNGKVRFDLLSRKDRKIGFVFQNYALLPHLSASKNIGFPLKMKGQKGVDVIQEIEHVAQELKIKLPNLSKKPEQLSEGMKQLVAIGRAKIKDLDLLLMDEPMSNIDPAVRIEIKVLIKRIVQDLGKTTIISTNDPEQVLSICDYVAVLDRGKLMQYGTVDSVYNNPVNALVMNILSPKAVNTMVVDVDAAEIKPFGISTDLENGKYQMCFRAEEVAISETGVVLHIDKSAFFDGKRNLVTGYVQDGVEVEVLLPRDADGDVCITPTNPVLFPI